MMPRLCRVCGILTYGENPRGRPTCFAHVLGLLIVVMVVTACDPPPFPPFPSEVPVVVAFPAVGASQTYWANDAIANCSCAFLTNVSVTGHLLINASTPYVYGWSLVCGAEAVELRFTTTHAALVDLDAAYTDCNATPHRLAYTP
jgi:hypothetical protein